MSKTVAFIPHGETFEEFFDTINMTFDQFCNDVNNSWLFGYIQSLQPLGYNFVIFWFSNKVTEVQMQVHKFSGTPVYLVPTPPWYKLFYLLKSKTKRGVVYQPSTSNSPGEIVKLPKKSKLRSAFRAVGPYLSTNVRLVLNLCKKHEVQGIITQEYEYARFDLSVLIGKLLNIPVYGSYQGGNETLSFVEKPFRNWAIKNCTGLIIPASVEYKRIEASYNKHAPVYPIFNPTEVDSWIAIDKTKARQENGLPPTKTIVMWHGRFVIHRKGLDVLLAAWAKLAKDDPNALLVMIGEGEDRDLLIKYLSLHDIHNYQIRGFTADRNQLVSLLSSADIYVFPSRHEGFALAPIEAASIGLPVVASAAPGVRDVFRSIDDGGLVSEVEDVDSFASDLNRLMSDKDQRLSLGRKARERALEAFSPDCIGNQLNVLF